MNKGSTENKTFYYMKDILFLAHEPIINNFRQYKIFLRKFKKAKDKGETEAKDRLLNNKPLYKLDHIVKERYPSIQDAVRDLDDALCLVFLFARMPTSRRVKPRTIHLCRRFAAEFQHWVMEARALRKTFISIKGIYYQAEVLGETVTWLVPHERGQPPPSDVDFAVMATFLDFYTTLLGFVNLALFQHLGLHYPPRLAAADEADSDSQDVRDMVECLGRPIARAAPQLAEEEKPDEFQLDDTSSALDERRQAEQQRVKRLPVLFAGLKVFLNREVPAEPLIFILRACGASVGWEGPGSPIAADDVGISHHIVDRPKLGKSNVNRRYVQPQWAFDSVNAGRRQSESDYFPGALLPPHLSPFVEEKVGDYVPPERLAQLKEAGVRVDELEGALETAVAARRPSAKRARKEEEEEEEKPVVKEGRVEPAEHPQAAKNRAGEELKMREALIAKRHKRVYHKIKKGKAKAARQAAAMTQKRTAQSS